MYVALACQTQLGSLNVSQAQELLKAASVNHFEESMQEGTSLSDLAFRLVFNDSP